MAPFRLSSRWEWAADMELTQALPTPARSEMPCSPPLRSKIQLLHLISVVASLYHSGSLDHSNCLKLGEPSQHVAGGQLPQPNGATAAQDVSITHLRLSVLKASLQI